MGIKHVIEGYRDMGEIFGFFREWDAEGRRIGWFDWDEDPSLEYARKKMACVDFGVSEFTYYRLGALAYCARHPIEYVRQIGRGKRVQVRRNYGAEGVQ
jgi:hypothetical protein